MAGCFSIVKDLSSLIQKCLNRNREEEEEGGSKPTNAFDGLIGCFLFAWFICGKYIASVVIPFILPSYNQQSIKTYSHFCIQLLFTCMCLYVLSSLLLCSLRFPHKTMFGSSLPPIVCRRAHVLFTLFVFVCA